MFKVNNKDTRTTPSVTVVNFVQVNAGWKETQQTSSASKKTQQS